MNSELENKPIDEASPGAEPARKSNKTLIFIIAAVAAAAIIAAVIFSAGAPMRQFKSLIGKGDFTAANEIYSKNDDNLNFLKQCGSYLSEYSDNIYDKYINNAIDYEEAINTINKYSSMYGVEDILRKIDEVEASRTAFSKGEELFNDKKYAKAYDMFSQVIENDKENYEKAAAKKEEIAGLVCTEAVEKSEQLTKSKKFKEAYSKLDDIGFEDERIETQKKKVVAAFEEYASAAADKLIAENDYAGAITIYSEMPNNILSESFKAKAKETENKYVSYVTEKVDRDIIQGYGLNAISFVEEEFEKSKVSALKALLDSTKKKYADQALAEADEYAASGDTAKALTSILSVGQYVSDSRLAEAEQKYRNALDSQSETLNVELDGLTATCTAKYYSSSYDTTSREAIAYKCYYITSLSLSNENLSSWNEYIKNWINEFSVPQNAVCEISRSQYEELSYYALAYENITLDHIAYDGGYYVSCEVVTTGDLGGGVSASVYSDSELHFLELIYGMEITDVIRYGPFGSPHY